MNFSDQQIWKILMDLLGVLKYLHFDKKIIHRDINPSNLLIDANYNIKLADFGLAQRFSQSMNMMNSFVGTLVYSRFISFIISSKTIKQSRNSSKQAIYTKSRYMVFRMHSL